MKPKLTKKQKLFVFGVLLFAAGWSAGLIGILAVLTLFFLAFLYDKRKGKK